MSFEDDEYWADEYDDYSFMPSSAVKQERHYTKRTAPDPVMPTRRRPAGGSPDEVAARRQKKAAFDSERPSWLDDPDFEPIDTSVENLAGDEFDDIDFNRPELGIDFDKPDFPIIDPAARPDLRRGAAPQRRGGDNRYERTVGERRDAARPDGRHPAPRYRGDTPAPDSAPRFDDGSGSRDRRRDETGGRRRREDMPARQDNRWDDAPPRQGDALAGRDGRDRRPAGLDPRDDPRAPFRDERREPARDDRRDGPRAEPREPSRDVGRAAPPPARDIGRATPPPARDADRAAPLSARDDSRGPSSYDGRRDDRREPIPDDRPGRGRRVGEIRSDELWPDADQGRGRNGDRWETAEPLRDDDRWESAEPLHDDERQRSGRTIELGADEYWEEADRSGPNNGRRDQPGRPGGERARSDDGWANDEFGPIRPHGGRRTRRDDVDAARPAAARRDEVDAARPAPVRRDDLAATGRAQVPAQPAERADGFDQISGTGGRPYDIDRPDLGTAFPADGDPRPVFEPGIRPDGRDQGERRATAGGAWAGDLTVGRSEPATTGDGPAGRTGGAGHDRDLTERPDGELAASSRAATDGPAADRDAAFGPGPRSGTEHADAAARGVVPQSDAAASPGVTDRGTLPSSGADRGTPTLSGADRGAMSPGAAEHGTRPHDAAEHGTRPHDGTDRGTLAPGVTDFGTLSPRSTNPRMSAASTAGHAAPSPSGDGRDVLGQGAVDRGASERGAPAQDSRERDAFEPEGSDSTEHKGADKRGGGWRSAVARLVPGQRGAANGAPAEPATDRDGRERPGSDAVQGQSIGPAQRTEDRSTDTGSGNGDTGPRVLRRAEAPVPPRVVSKAAPPPVPRVIKAEPPVTPRVVGASAPVPPARIIGPNGTQPPAEPVRPDANAAPAARSGDAGAGAAPGHRDTHAATAHGHRPGVSSGPVSPGPATHRGPDAGSPAGHAPMGAGTPAGHGQTGAGTPAHHGETGAGTPVGHPGTGPANPGDGRPAYSGSDNRRAAESNPAGESGWARGPASTGEILRDDLGYPGDGGRTDVPQQRSRRTPRTAHVFLPEGDGPWAMVPDAAQPSAEARPVSPARPSVPDEWVPGQPATGRPVVIPGTVAGPAGQPSPAAAWPPATRPPVHGEGAPPAGDPLRAGGPAQAGPTQAGPTQAGPTQAGSLQAGPDQAASALRAGAPDGAVQPTAATAWPPPARPAPVPGRAVPALPQNAPGTPEDAWPPVPRQGPAAPARMAPNPAWPGPPADAARAEGPHADDAGRAGGHAAPQGVGGAGAPTGGWPSIPSQGSGPAWSGEQRTSRAADLSGDQRQGAAGPIGSDGRPQSVPQGTAGWNGPAQPATAGPRSAPPAQEQIPPSAAAWNGFGQQPPAAPGTAPQSGAGWNHATSGQTPAATTPRSAPPAHAATEPQTTNAGWNSTTPAQTPAATTPRSAPPAHAAVEPHAGAAGPGGGGAVQQASAGTGDASRPEWNGVAPQSAPPGSPMAGRNAPASAPPAAAWPGEGRQATDGGWNAATPISVPPVAGDQVGNASAPRSAPPASAGVSGGRPQPAGRGGAPAHGASGQPQQAAGSRLAPADGAPEQGQHTARHGASRLDAADEGGQHAARDGNIPTGAVAEHGQHAARAADVRGERPAGPAAESPTADRPTLALPKPDAARDARTVSGAAESGGAGREKIGFPLARPTLEGAEEQQRPYMDADGTLHNLRPIGRLEVAGPDTEPRRYADTAMGSGWFVSKAAATGSGDAVEAVDTDTSGADPDSAGSANPSGELPTVGADDHGGAGTEDGDAGTTPSGPGGAGTAAPVGTAGTPSGTGDAGGAGAGPGVVGTGDPAGSGAHAAGTDAIGSAGAAGTDTAGDAGTGQTEAGSRGTAAGQVPAAGARDGGTGAERPATAGLATERPQGPDLAPHLPLTAADLSAIRWRLDGGTLREVVDDRNALRALGERLDGPLADEADNIVKAGLLSVRAEVYRLLGELGMAAAASRLALAHAESAHDLQSMVIAQAELAHVLRLRGDYMEADRLFQRAVDADVSPAVRSVVHENAGRSCFDQGRHMEALDHFARAIRLGAPDDTDLVERVGVCLEAVYIHVLRDGWGPYPRKSPVILAPLGGRPAEDGEPGEPGGALTGETAGHPTAPPHR
ncbi:hypothetical protein QLQ12_15555 [Actinoplanes sp. NEAU-A12]|uniref:Uncharacterized protein n=1 Tax=Actinoplanes sandaracinus TaxID=3045177 RepID=A0ABT6WJW2_9ACTN|nr:hypothetical protein [Actinoplanes sandaracinus]MDI6100017.1 hypothetical protein [Actinoplanes sandaracinus]